MNKDHGREESFRADINAMRALAVLAVIAFHFGVAGAGSGYIGVDVFFVISGYLVGGHIAARLAGGGFTLAGFFAGRIRRIVPALAALCFAVLAWGWFYQLGTDYRELSWSARSTLLFGSNQLFARQLGYFDLGAAYKPLLHTWSLSIEGQFYLLLPLFLLLVARIPAGWKAAAVAAVAALSFGAAIWQGQQAPQHVFFSFAARAWEFLAGCAVAWYSRGVQRWLPTSVALRKGLAGIACAGLVAACFLLPAGLVWPGPWTLLPVLLSAAMIALGQGVVFGRFTRSAPLQHLGNISYSLYLWHWPVVVVWRLMTMRESVDAASLVLLAVLTWLLAWLSWRFVEQPWRRGGGRKPARAIGGFLATALAFVVFAVITHKTQGLPLRLPEYVRGAEIASRLDDDLSGCWHLPGALPGENPLACAIGPASSQPPGFAVWGDSHALVYLRPLREQTLQGSGLLFHRPGCEPAPPGASGKPGCDSHNEQVRRVLQATPSVRNIVIAIRHAEPEKTAHAWEAARQLALAGYRVSYLGPLPEARRAVAQDWAMRQLVRREPVREMTIAPDEATRVDSYELRLRRWKEGASQSPQQGLQPIDLSDLFCDVSRCWLVQDGVGLLRDTDHLTAAGVARVLPRLLPQLGQSSP